MKTLGSLIAAGQFGKPHGIRGEIAVTVDTDAFTPTAGQFVFAAIDNLPVPFRILDVRTKGSHTFLLTLFGMDDEKKAAAIALKDMLVQQDDLSEMTDEADEADGFYYDDLIGFTAIDSDSGLQVGTISDFDDSTENILFSITRPDGTEALIPAAPELIADIDPENNSITINIPQGLFDIDRS